MNFVLDKSGLLRGAAAVALALYLSACGGGHDDATDARGLPKSSAPQPSTTKEVPS